MSGPPAPRGAARAGIGVLLVQLLGSLTSVLQVVLFAGLVDTALFDGYSVWLTAFVVAAGLAQCAGSERVVVGRRTLDQGRAATLWLGVAVVLVGLAVAWWVGSWVLAGCSLALLPAMAWDFVRITEGIRDPWPFLRRDLAVLVLQFGLVGAAVLAGAPHWAAPAVWWAGGGLVWAWFARTALTGSDWRRGVRALREDLPEAWPLLVDAALAGVPLVAALAVARAAAPPGVAADARLALSVLGPISVVNVAGRRLVFARLARGPLRLREAGGLVVLVVAALSASLVALALTRTGVYDGVLPTLGPLTWGAIAWFTLDRSALIASIWPAGTLRVRARTGRVALARLVSATAAGAVLATGVDSVQDVARVSSLNSLVFLGAVALASLTTGRLSEVRGVPVRRSRLP